jgi:hypothetical protein
MALLQDKVARGLIREKLGAVAEDEVIELEHRPLPRGIVSRWMRSEAESVGLGKLLQPLESPLHRAHDAVGVPSSKVGLPAVHPACVEFAYGTPHFAVFHLALWAWRRNCSTTADMSSSPCPAEMACSNTRKAALPMSRSRPWWSASLTA